MKTPTTNDAIRNQYDRHTAIRTKPSFANRCESPPNDGRSI
jgi:hypothetical protein